MLINAVTGAMTPFVDDDSNADSPVWSEDGTRILYSSDRCGSYEVYERHVGNASADRLILPSKTYAQPIASARTGHSRRLPRQVT